ncbi:MAG: BCD family MFS transporter [Proteobacteria bacterium]|jgi:BCD family chlorophyll transporter-like MFS transporter|nr:BCD family MFS transporter [Pseudomonadota bacterium]
MTAPSPTTYLGWLGIVRLGLVQTALGAIVVLTTSTLNRIMVVELALPAMIPGALVALHYAVQLLRPRLGHGSDVGGRRTPWIFGGMVVLGLGGVSAAAATALMATAPVLGVIAATAAFLVVGIGVGASGTNLLVLLAKRVAPERRPAAATIVWMMMIFGFIITAASAGAALEPFSFTRLLIVSSTVAVGASALTALALWGIESTQASPAEAQEGEKLAFREALATVWEEKEARRFTLFIFVSMLAYSAQDLILEPFAGTVFGMTPGASTQLAGVQNGGVLLGMILVALLGHRLGTADQWTRAGCMASGAALVLLAGLGLGLGQSEVSALRGAVFALGFANGVFAVSAIGAMMGLVGQGQAGREGVRMGLWGAAQAVAFGLGGFLGTLAIDLTRALLNHPGLAYAVVFFLEAGCFFLAAYMTVWVAKARDPHRGQAVPLTGVGL